MAGKIAFLRLENFMSYENCQIYPGEIFNIIIGPNGTGKSSIVCGICLALAGSTKILMRAKEIVEYVKFGYSRSLLEIHLYKSQSIIKIKRIINKDNKKSSYFINDIQCTESEVVKVRKSLSINFDNLCSFLPQDRVVHFTRLNSCQLLKSVQETIDESLLKDYNELIEKEKKRNSIQNKIHSISDDLSNLKRRNELIENEVQQINEWKKINEHLMNLNRKKSWRMYENQRLLCIEISKECRDLRNKLDDLSNDMKPNEKLLSFYEQRIKNVSSIVEKKIVNFNKGVHYIEKNSKKIEQHTNDISDCLLSIKYLEESITSKEQRINNIKKQVVILNEELSQLHLLFKQEDVDMINKNILSKSSSYKELTNKQLNKINDQKKIEDCKTKLISQITHLKFLENSRIEKLKNIDMDCYKSIVWLRENYSIFKQKVFEPIYLQINMHNIENAKYIESHISKSDLLSFVCCSTEDLKLLVQELRKKRNYRISGCVSEENNSLKSYKTSMNIDDLKKFRFKYFLSDCFSAPDVIRSFLFKSYHIHNVPVFGALSDTELESVSLVPNITTFFSENSKISVKISSYTNWPSSRVSNIQSTKLIETHINYSLLDDLNLQLKNLEDNYNDLSQQIKLIMEKMNQNEIEIDSLRTEKKTLLGMQNKINLLKIQIDAKNKTLETEVLTDENDLVREQKTKLSNLFNEKIANYIDKNHSYQKWNSSFKEINYYESYQSVLHEKSISFKSKYNQLVENFKNMQMELENVKIKKSDMLEKAKELLDEAKSCSGIQTDGDKIPKSLKNIFGDLPDNVEVLEQMIFKAKTFIDSNHTFNERTITEFTNREQQINNLNVQIENLKNEITNSIMEEADLKNKWILEINKIVEQTNRVFNQIFSIINCLGKVELNGHESKIENMGIDILVSFRKEEPLAPLSDRQSGGERSISTMLFLLALQDLSNCPFRIIDEINQGMDSNYERYIFKILSELVNLNSKCQYFIFSPKVLTNLTYSPEMTVLTIFNGQSVVYQKNDYEHQEIEINNNNQTFNKKIKL